MGYVSCLGRSILIFFNIIFIEVYMIFTDLRKVMFTVAEGGGEHHFSKLVCLIFIALGLLLRYYPDFIQANDVLETLELNVKAAFPVQQNTYNTNEFHLGVLFDDVALVLIIMGFIFLIFCFFGCCGGCYKVKVMLLTYAVMVGILLVAEIVFVIMAYSRPDTVKDHLKPMLQGTLTNYQGMNGTNAHSVAWNYVMMEFECCGPVNYKDFDLADNWWAKGVAVTPWACCVDLPDSFGEAQYCANHNRPSQGVADLDGINTFDKGCVDALWERVMEGNKTWLIAVTACFFFFQTLLIIFAVVLFLSDGKKIGQGDSARILPTKHEDRRDHYWT